MSGKPSKRLCYVPLSEEHIPLLLPIEREAYPDPWSKGMFAQEIDHRSSCFFVALLEDEIVGYAGFWYVAGEAHITKVTVAAPYRRQGYASRLMAHLLDCARSLEAETVRLEVREHNVVARRLYEKCGFVQVGLRRGYYSQTNETAVVMARVL
jgi:ribosomal-protein-alanine N-acetyltransferase